MSFWGWVGAIAAGWFTASILLAGAWALVGKRIFRSMPLPPNTTVTINGQSVDATTDAVVTKLKRRNRTNGSI